MARAGRWWAALTGALARTNGVTRVVTSVVLLALVALGLVAVNTVRDDGHRPVAVPASALAAILEASTACPTQTGPRLAAQVMEASGFDPKAGTRRGGSGVAGLTDAAWQQWAPWPDASRSDARASILALAHDMCDLVGRVRVAALPGDPWRLSLAAYRSGLDAVTAARGVPDQAADYVTLVSGYARWYESSDQFISGTSVQVAGSPAAAAAAAPVAVPDGYVGAVVAAGQVCADVPPARVAAVLMAASGFNPNLLGPDGAEGIAGFRPELWSRYAASASASPWNPATAVPALGRALCDLFGTVQPPAGADRFLTALVAFERGLTAVGDGTADPAGTLVRQLAVQMGSYVDYYAGDTRLHPTNEASPGPSANPAGGGGNGSGNGGGGAGSQGGAGANTPGQPTPVAPATSSTPKNSLMGRASGRCLSSADGNDGTRLEIWTCDGTASQRWTVQGSTLRSQGLCMDAANAGTGNGTPVQIATCSGNPAQKFTLRADGSIYSSSAGRCVDVVDFGTGNGTKLQLWDCAGTTNQSWSRR